MEGLLRQASPDEQGQVPPEKMPDDTEVVDDSTDNPQFIQAMQFAIRALYENNAGKNLIAAVKKSQDKSQTLAMLVYEMAGVALEQVPDVPEDYWGLMAAELLAEAGEILEAGGVKLSAADISGAFKMMLLRFLGEAGVDTRGLEEAMAKISPEDIESVASKLETV